MRAQHVVKTTVEGVTRQQTSSTATREQMRSREQRADEEKRAKTREQMRSREQRAESVCHKTAG